MSAHHFSTVATILGNPIYWGSPPRDHTPDQLASLKALGVNTLFVNLAWSRPWMDAVTLAEAHVSPTYPWLSDPTRVATNAPRLRWPQPPNWRLVCALITAARSLCLTW
jgi:hypothetical protein